MEIAVPQSATQAKLELDRGIRDTGQMGLDEDNHYKPAGEKKKDTNARSRITDTMRSACQWTCQCCHTRSSGSLRPAVTVAATEIWRIGNQREGRYRQTGAVRSLQR